MPRLRVTVFDVTPGHVRFGVFQSDNGVNWGHAGVLSVRRSWFEDAFGPELAEAGTRFEFETGDVHPVGG